MIITLSLLLDIIQTLQELQSSTSSSCCHRTFIAISQKQLLWSPHLALSLTYFLQLDLKWLTEPDEIILNRHTVVEVRLKTQNFAGEWRALWVRRESMISYLLRFDIVWFSSSFSTWSWLLVLAVCLSTTWRILVFRALTRLHFYHLSQLLLSVLPLFPLLFLLGF